MFSGGPLDLTATLIDKHQKDIAFNDDSGDSKNFSLTQNLEKGDYYIRVQGYSENEVGDYDLSIKFNQTFSSGI